ncbi:MAG: hypothetical protein ACI9XZ_000608 [Alphaproteobacteria bacterium]|jgi:hypothetical protein
MMYCDRELDFAWKSGGLSMQHFIENRWGF